jgi:hypothetical protein
MKSGFWKMKGIFILIFFGLSIQESLAQLGTKSEEVWPTIDVYYKLNPRFRLYGTLSGTKTDNSNYSDGGVGVFFDYFTFPLKFSKAFLPHRNDSLPGKFLWLRGGYQYTASPRESENPFKEHVFVTEANARWYLPFSILGTLKNRVDWIIQENDFKARYRPRIVLERDFKTEYLFFTASGFVEYFIYFGQPNLNRLRTQIGVEMRVTKRMNYEVFWNHQFANSPDVSINDAFGMSFKFYLHSGDKIFVSKQKNQLGAGL